MKLILTINMDNAAFDNDEEVVRILREYADRVDQRGLQTDEPLRDVNGNTVGSARIASQRVRS